MENERLAIALHLQHRIGLPLGPTELGAMLMQTHSFWEQQIEKGLWTAIDQGTQTIIPDLFHVPCLQYILFSSVYRIDCYMSILKYK